MQIGYCKCGVPVERKNKTKNPTCFECKRKNHLENARKQRLRKNKTKVRR